MNALHHRQKTPGHVLPTPEGLQELMSDISREVLRCQPSIDCTYKFIADYLESMVKTRDKQRIALEVIEEAILMTDEVYSELAKCSFPKDKTKSFVDVMELTFRRFVDKKRTRNEDPRLIKFHEDDLLDELMRKCDLTKVEVLRSRPAIQWAYRKFVKTYLTAIEGTLDTEDLYFETEKLIASSKERNQMHQSAIQIQKVFRGYKTRKSLQKSSQKFQLESSEDSSSTSSFRDFILGRQEELNKAAIKIQASYKGFYVRKKNALDRQNALSKEEVKKKVSLRPYRPGTEDRTPSEAKEQSIGFSDSEAVENSLKEEEHKLPSTEDIHTIPTQASGIDEIEDKVIQEDISNHLIQTEETVIVLLQDLDNNLENKNEAAAKIQATFKGYKVRKELQHKKDKDNTLLEQPSKHSQ